MLRDADCSAVLVAVWSYSRSLERPKHSSGPRTLGNLFTTLNSRLKLAPPILLAAGVLQKIGSSDFDAAPVLQVMPHAPMNGHGSELF